MDTAKKILVIDDDKIIIQIIKQFLGTGFEVLTSASEQETFLRLKEFNPDVILLDIVLPDISGLEIFERLSAMEEYRSIPVILLTSLDCNQDISMGLAAGRYDYIQKPVNKFELLARINAAYKLNKYLAKLKSSNAENKKLISMLNSKIAEEKLNKEQIKQAEVIKKIQEMIGSIALEFSQPLQVLTLYYGLMQKHVQKPEFLTKSKAMIDRIGDLVNKLKSIIQLEKQDYLGSEMLDLTNSSKSIDTLCNLKVVKDVKVVLVAEDEPGILESIVELLRMNGYECDGASDGQAALEMGRTKKYDLIVTDISMPNLTGFELFKEMKRLGYGGFFMFMTGFEVSGEVRNSLDIADGIIIKPFEYQDFLEKIDKLKRH